EFNKLAISDFLIPSYSYVSVIELSNYLAKDSDEDPYQNEHVRKRLYPEVPKSRYICFYPMDKRREGNDNWYMLDMEKRRELRSEFNKLAISDFLIPSYSYVSVIELSNYLAKDSDEDPYQNEHVRKRLYPEVPKSRYICFYPMDKRREGNDNWYMLDMEKRREL